MINQINFSCHQLQYPSYKTVSNVIPFKGSNVHKDYLSGLDNLSSVQAFEYLTDITSNDEKAEDFINEITKNPQDSAKITRRLVNALGSKHNFDKWYFGENGYFQAFNKHIEKYFNEAKSIEELVKYMPNWGDWKLNEKSRILNGDENFTIGKLPSEFGSKKTFQKLSENIRDKYYTPERTYYENIDGKEFNISYPKNGLSGKIVAVVNDDYILKTAYSPKYKADSPYMNAMVDYYLNANNSSNACKMYYYDDKSHSILYEKSNLPECKYKTLGKEWFYSPKTIFDNFNDAKSLGISFTDRGTSNYRTDGINNIAIDSGHAEYTDILKPGLTGYHIMLPSNTGFSNTMYNGVMSEIIGFNK